MQPIIPCLWFNTEAEEAAKFYIGVFKNGSIDKITRYGEAGFEVHHKPARSVMTVNFMLNGQKFVALNGGPEFKFNESISLMVHCKTQAEIDYYWENLSQNGEQGPCGWLKDKYGLSWQVVPQILESLLNSAHADQVMKALLQMKKLDIAKLEEASATQQQTFS